MGFKKYGPSRNLFDSTNFGLVQVTETVYRKGSNLGVLPQGTYILSATTNNPVQIYRTTKTGDTYNVETVNVLPYSFTADGVSEQIFRTTGTAGDSWADLGYSNIMLNTGSTALPYEPYGNVWQLITPKKLKGIPYSGTLPATLTGTKAGYLHRYKIFGNTEQTGTPTPENPIVPSECGERTGNMFDYIYYFNHSGAGVNVYFNLKGIITLKANTTYTFSTDFKSKTSGTRETPFIACRHNGTPTTANGGFGNDGTVTITTDATGMIDLYTRTSAGSTQSDVDIPTLSDFENGKWVMLTEGSTSLPYEPYGYKLPLTSAGQDVDIYLGDSQTTRIIKKKVLTGAETWYSSTVNPGAVYAGFSQFPGIKANSPIVCSHLVDSYGETYRQGTCIVLSSVGFWFFDTATSPAAFKAYLEEQLANGTPVTVWYILATEETGTLNEPLRKIGDYADTIDSTQTSAQIPTSANSTTISWAGEGIATSQFDSIAEWVDIPTYTYTNGAWVADN